MTLGATLSTVLIGWVLINGFMFLAQPGMLFYPTSDLNATPKDWGMDFQDVTLQSEDGKSLHAWFVPRDGSDLVALFFHGNAGNISHRGDSIAVLQRLGLNVFIFDYRGYGLSHGTPTEQGLYRDARAAWQWLTEQGGFAPDRVVLFGRSLGGVVAAKLASEVTPGAIILESSFSSAKDVAHSLFPLLSRIVWLRFELDAARYLEGATAPVLVLHSPEDEIIPYPLGRRLFDTAPEPKRFVDLIGGHNDGFLRSQPAYGHAINDFLRPLSSLEAQRDARRH